MPDTDGNPPPSPWKDWPQAKRDAAVALLNNSNWQNLINSMPVAKIFRPGDVANVATIVIPGQETDNLNTLGDERQLRTVPGPYKLPDYDRDGNPDVYDPDDDNDETPDTSDPAPQDPSVPTANNGSPSPSPEPSPSPSHNPSIVNEDMWSDVDEINNPSSEISQEAQAIANGHAFNDHRAEFPEIANRYEFAQLIDDIMNNPSESKQLENRRTAYWYAASNTLVIKDPGDIDGGIAFRPSIGKTYYDQL